jgi:lipopolysaccharide transport system permease protein
MRRTPVSQENALNFAVSRWTTLGRRLSSFAMSVRRAESVRGAGMGSDMPPAEGPGHRRELPRMVIVPPRGFAAFRFGELWIYRELLFFLTWRDVKVRYKQTFFGAAWAVLQPLLLMAVFAIFIGRVAGIKPSGVPYTLFAYAGLVPWALFAAGVAAASNSLVLNQALVSKVYFPRLLLPVAAASSFVVDLFFSSLLLVLMMLFESWGFHATILLAPAFALLALASSLGIGILLSAINVRYRDVAFAIPLVVQLWLFATPVAYALSIVPPRWRVVYGLNPMASAVEGFRWSFLGRDAPPVGTVAVSIVTTAVILVAGLVYFKRAERSFADVI